MAVKKTTIGGQALIEGLLMIGPEKRAMAVRRPDGNIALENLAPIRTGGAAKILFVRGSVRLFRQLVSGTKALLRSAELADEAEQEQKVQSSNADISENSLPEKKPETLPWHKRLFAGFDRWLTRHSDVMLYLSAALGILFSIVLFILLPNFLTSFLRQLPAIQDLNARAMTIVLNLIEGLLRIIIFITYLALTSRIKEIQRVWMYHGAEHKTIACYEDGKDLTVSQVRSYSRFHPRCGTAFLFIVIVVSIIVFSFAGWWSRWINLLIRFALVPLVAGIAYEVVRFSGRYDNRLTRIISAPGLWLQRFTTLEPDDSMLEVAIAAMDAVRPEGGNSDQW